MASRPTDKVIEARATKSSLVEEILAKVLLRLIEAEKLPIREEKT